MSSLTAKVQRLETLRANQARLLIEIKGAERELALELGVIQAGTIIVPAPETGAKPVRAYKKRRKRAKITPAMRLEVVKLTKAGESAKAIAATVGISVGSVAAIRKESKAK